MFVPNFKIVDKVVAEKSVPQIFSLEKEKWTNKGNDKHENAESLLCNASSHAKYLYQISKS